MPDPQQQTRIQLTFRGRVQGVGFRATTHHIAVRHPVSGWVKNLSDGSVRAQLQGSPADIDAVLHQITTVMARNIQSIDRIAMSLLVADTGFHIR